MMKMKLVLTIILVGLVFSCKEPESSTSSLNSTATSLESSLQNNRQCISSDFAPNETKPRYNSQSGYYVNTGCDSYHYPVKVTPQKLVSCYYPRESIVYSNVPLYTCKRTLTTKIIDTLTWIGGY